MQYFRNAKRETRESSNLICALRNSRELCFGNDDSESIRVAIVMVNKHMSSGLTSIPAVRAGHRNCVSIHNNCSKNILAQIF